MNLNIDTIDDANRVALHHLIRQYLPLGSGESFNASVEGASVEGKPVGRRYGIPADATAWRIIIEHPEQEWTVTARAVWRDGDLLSPTATHAVFERYYDDAERYGSEDAVRVAVNEWFQSW